MTTAPFNGLLEQVRVHHDQVVASQSGVSAAIDAIAQNVDPAQVEAAIAQIRVDIDTLRALVAAEPEYLAQVESLAVQLEEARTLLATGAADTLAMALAEVERIDAATLSTVAAIEGGQPAEIVAAIVDPSNTLSRRPVSSRLAIMRRAEEMGADTVEAGMDDEEIEEVLDVEQFETVAEVEEAIAVYEEAIDAIGEEVKQKRADGDADGEAALEEEAAAYEEAIELLEEHAAELEAEGDPAAGDEDPAAPPSPEAAAGRWGIKRRRAA